MTHDIQALTARLLEHAAIHEAEHQRTGDAEQEQWAADLRDAAALLSAAPACPATQR